jgi:hypothetical protein
MEDLEYIKQQNKKDLETFTKLILNLNTLEKKMEKKLEILVDRIHFVNNLFNQSLDSYHTIVVNLIDDNNKDNEV